MNLPQATTALSALAHDHRLAVFRRLVQAGPDGLAAGAIAREMYILPSTLSGYLTTLEQAGLVTSRRESRSIIYTANYAGMGELLSFLVADCCEGRPEICSSVVEAARNCCPTP